MNALWVMMDLKIKDVADLLNVSERTIRRWLVEKKIPAYRLNHQYRFNRMEIENWMMKCRIQDQNIDSKNNKETLQSDNDTQEQESLSSQGMQQFSLYRALHHGNVLADLESVEKNALILEAVNHFSTDLPADPAVLVELLLDRERLMSTGLNNGIAIPHTRDFILKGPSDYVAVVFLKQPIEWGALDRKHVHTLFFLFAGDDKRHLHLLAKIAHFSSQKASLEFMHSRPSKCEFLEYVKNWEAESRSQPVPV